MEPLVTGLYIQLVVYFLIRMYCLGHFNKVIIPSNSNISDIGGSSISVKVYSNNSNSNEANDGSLKKESETLKSFILQSVLRESAAKTSRNVVSFKDSPRNDFLSK